MIDILYVTFFSFAYAFGAVGLYAIFLRNLNNKIYIYLGVLFWPITLIVIGWVLMVFLVVEETE